MKLLLAEDDRDLSTWLSRLLRRSGYAVEQAFNGEEAELLLRTQDYDAILLDLNLPLVSGQTLLRRLRKQDNGVPVLIISAQDSLQDIVDLLDLGADDYLPKPFDIEELEARLRSLLRRACGKANPIFTCGQLCYDSNSKIFRIRDQPLPLPPREHALLEALLRKVGKTVAKQHLADSLVTLNDLITREALEVYIMRLRKKLDDSGAAIITLRGLGYMLSSEAA